MVEGYMWFNVSINMTSVSHTPSSSDNQRVIVKKGATISEIGLYGQDCVDDLAHHIVFSK